MRPIWGRSQCDPAFFAVGVMILPSTEVFAEGKDYTSDPRGNSAEQKRVALLEAAPFLFFLIDLP